MDHPVEVASFHRGELQSIRLLSLQEERRAVWVATVVVAGIVAAAMFASLGVARAAGLVLHAPTFFVSWGAVAGFIAWVAMRRVRSRVRRYRIGAEVDADAFAAVDADLVQRGSARGSFHLQLAPGMSGVIETARSRIPVEALIEGRCVTAVPVPADGSARVEIGPSTFVIRPASHTEAPSLGSEATLMVLAQAAVGRLSRLAAGGIPLAVLATLFASTPRALAVSESEMRSAIPSNATPLQTERMLRDQAQRQAPTLHQCFDALPLICQHAGYVGVGLDLDRSGAVKGHWVSRSTYGHECPVSACMEQVVSGWFFEPIPSPSMRLVLPVQVLSKRDRGLDAQLTVIPVQLHP